MFKHLLVDYLITINTERYCQTLLKPRTAIKYKTPIVLSKSLFYGYQCLSSCCYENTGIHPHSNCCILIYQTQELLEKYGHEHFLNTQPILLPLCLEIYPFPSTKTSFTRKDIQKMRRLWNFFYMTDLEKLIPLFDKSLNSTRNYVEKYCNHVFI